MSAGFAYDARLALLVVSQRDAPSYRHSSVTAMHSAEANGLGRGSVIIRRFASKSLFIMLLGALRLKRAVIVLIVVVFAGFGLTSCNKSSSKAATGQASGVTFRAFVSQDVTFSTLLAPGLIVVDASKDLRANIISSGGLLGPSFFPGKMFLSNDHQMTMVISSTGTAIQMISNSKESVTTTVNLPTPGTTESLAISVDDTTGFAAVPNAPIPLGPPGGIQTMNLTNGTVTATVPIPSAHYVVQNGDGSKLLVFSDNSDAVTIVYPFNIVLGQQSSTCPTTGPTPTCQAVTGFDRPVYAFFSSDGTQAWVLNCGPECGGQQASVQLIDLVHGIAGAAVPIPGGATVGFVHNRTLWVAGNAAAGSGNETCTSGTPALCGRLTTVDMPSLTVTGTATGIEIPDGYHTQLNMSGDGQLFVGSRNCTNIVPANTGDPQRGCLAIVNLASGAVVFPPDNGDVTGMTPITNRTVFYVVEGGELRIYDTTTDKIYTKESIDVFGQAVDVKLIDF